MMFLSCNNEHRNECSHSNRIRISFEKNEASPIDFLSDLYSKYLTREVCFRKQVFIS